MMLDMKRTFDEVVEAHSTPEKAAQILANPFYQSVSSSFAGTQEYMAMEKLGQLRAEAEREGTWDLIVVDTPPSRSALDFLDAPKRLGSFLDGRFIRLLTAPARAGGKAYLKVFSVGATITAATLSKVLGGQFLADVQTFVAALDTMFGGLPRARRRHLRPPQGARDRLRRRRGARAGRPARGGLLRRPAGERGDAARRRRREPHADARGTGAQRQPGRRRPPSSSRSRDGRRRSDDASADRSRADRGAAAPARRPRRRGERHEGHVRRFVAGHPRVQLSTVPASATDIHDLEGLRTVGAALAG